MHNVFTSTPRLLLAVLTATLLSLCTIANAQVFYTGEGLSGYVGKVTGGGSPSTLAYYPGGDVQGVTADSLGNAYVAVGSSVYQITPGGTSTLYANYANPIGGLAMSSAGILYGISTAGGPLGGHDVGVYNPDGTFTSLSLSNPGFVPFYPSNGIKFDSAGNLFITNSGNGGQYGESVLKLTPSGSDWTTSAFTSYALGSYKPFDVVTDPAGNVYVSSANELSAIRKYDSNGVQDMSFTLSGLASPTFNIAGLAYANNKLYALIPGTYKLWEIDPVTGAATDFLGAGNFLPDYRGTFLTYSPVPEPATGGLILLGGIGLIGLKARRKRAHA